MTSNIDKHLKVKHNKEAVCMTIFYSPTNKDNILTNIVISIDLKILTSSVKIAVLHSALCKIE